MFSPILAVALLSSMHFASANEKRQATDDASFTAAAEALIDTYIPSSLLPEIESRVSSAASVAGVAGSPMSLLYDGVLAVSVPGWLESAIPSQWSTQFAALESGVNALRPTPPAGPTIATVVAVTTTDSAGSTFTTSFTSTPVETGSTTSTTVYAGGVYTSLTTQVIDGVTSVFETAFSGASSVASDASSGVSEGISGASSVATAVSGGISEGISGASSVATVVSGGISEGISGASSVATEASGVIDSASSVATEASGFLAGATSTGGASVMATAVSGAAAGVIGMVGLMIAL